MPTKTIRVPIEVDVTYVNKTWFSLKKKVNPYIKHYVIGFFQRGAGNVPGKAIIKTLLDNKPETIEVVMMETIKPGCMIYSEENTLPTYLKDAYEIHEFKEAGADLHINNVNNMWRDLKRNLKRTHVQVSQKHLQLYCSEVAWQINHAHLTPQEKFDVILSNCSVENKKTSYKNLIK